MKVFGLTGGIGSGKTTVADMLRTIGVPVIDMDKLAHLALTRSDVWDWILENWPKVVETKSNGFDIVNRKKLGKIVFSDPKQMEILEEALSPAIDDALHDRLNHLSEGGATVAIIDSALICERKVKTDGTMLIMAPEKDRIKRVMKRNGMSRKDVLQRMAFQWSDQEKLRKVKWAIDNDGSVWSLKSKVLEWWLYDICDLNTVRT